MSKKSQEHPYIPALNGEVLRTKHDKKTPAQVNLSKGFNDEVDDLREVVSLFYTI